MTDRPYRTVDGQRLVWWQETSSPTYWYNRFHDRIAHSHQSVAENKEAYYFHLFARYLPKMGKILEAGSGDGAVVAYLLREGFDAEGVDYSSDLVDAVLKTVPGLPVRSGNVLHLGVPDGYYSGYLSLGVIEHRFEGCQPFLQEAYRVVAPGGILVFTVPYFNMVRRVKYKLGKYLQPSADLEFYQYGFSKSFFKLELERAGLELVHFDFYDTRFCIKEEFPKLLKTRGIWRISNKLRVLDRFGFASHMIMAVTRRP